MDTTKSSLLATFFMIFMLTESQGFEDLTNNHTQSPHKCSEPKAGIIGGIIGPFAILAILYIGLIIYSYQKIRKHDEDYERLRTVLVNNDMHFFAFTELQTATNNFDARNEVGRGGFGIVYKGALQNGSVIAVKKFIKPGRDNDDMMNFVNEATIVSKINHRCLVQLKGCCIDSPRKDLLLVHEFLENGSLSTILWGSESEVLTWDTRLNICMGIAEGLSYLHEEIRPRILHRDIKAANILLDANMNPKIGDFGFVRIFPSNVSYVDSFIRGTRGYNAPEYADNFLLTPKADVYSFGVLILEIITAQKCYNRDLPLVSWVREMKNRHLEIRVVDPKILDNYNEEEARRMITLALSCLESPYFVRPAMSEVVFELRSMFQRRAQRADPTRLPEGNLAGPSSSVYDPTLPEGNLAGPSSAIQTSEITPTH